MTSKYPTLASPIELGGVTVRNRLAHASILTKFVRDGQATDELIHYHGARARGGTGLIVTEPIAMTAHNRLAHRLRAWDDGAYDSLARLAEAVETADSRLLGQVQDSGRGRHAVGRNDGAVGASALPDDLSWTVPRVLDSSGIRQMIADWASASARLKRAGFAGVEISAGHGHLFHQFLSAWSNRRDDEYGGDITGRTRFVRELVAAIRSECATPFIIGLKLPGDDGIDGSIDLAEARRLARAIAEDGNVDYWTFAWGAHANSLYRHLPDAHGERHPYLDAIRELRQVAPDIPTGALGYITDANECELALTDGTADLVFLGRALITDPAFGTKAFEGREAEIRYCVSCNTCWRAIIEGGRLECDNNPRVGSADEERWRPRPATKPRRVAIVGGGIAGLEAAHTAARRGHDVTLFSAADEVGGKTRLHAELPGGENLSSIYDYQFLAGRSAGVRFELGVTATLGDIETVNPDALLLASGATMSVPDWVPAEYAGDGLIPDLRELAREMLGRSGREPGRLLLVDRDHTEMTYAAAELFAERFENVTIVTPRERLASDCSLINRQGIYQRLHDLGIRIVTCAEPRDLDRLEEAEVELINVYNGSATLVDEIVAITYATARVPALAPDLVRTDKGWQLDVIGDCRAPRSVLAATREGYDIALAL